MKTTQKISAVLLLALTTATAPALAAQATLKIGDPAPKLQNGQWMQGDPVKDFQPGKAYIVEFWATWCGPCRSSIPHLNDIYTKYKDRGLVVIGQDCWEQDDAKVGTFIKNMGDKMTYRVALDDKTDGTKGKMAETWMAAAGRNGIPSAFLIDTKGLVAWIGHPMELEEKEDIIDQVLAGKFDIQKAAAEYEKETRDQAARQKELAPMQAKMGEMAKAMRAKNWDEAMDDLAAAEKLIPENRRASMSINFDVNRFRILIGKKNYPDAYHLASKMGDDYKSNAGLLNYLAWTIATDKTIDKRDLDVAATLANRANDAGQGKVAAYLDTQARVLFMKGQKAEAVQAEAKAVALAGTDEKPDLQDRLDSYKKGELPDVN